MSQIITSGDDMRDRDHRPGKIQSPMRKTACLVTADGLLLKAYGFGREGQVTGELCFNTAMTGYQEILTDPSYASQIITFTFPHIGNVGANDDDIESVIDTRPVAAKGLILREAITPPSNYRATSRFEEWVLANELIGMWGVDTRALAAHIRDRGLSKIVLCHRQDGQFDEEQMRAQAQSWSGLAGCELAGEVTAPARQFWSAPRPESLRWNRPITGKKSPDAAHRDDMRPDDLHPDGAPFHVIAIDFGIKANSLNLLAERDCQITLVPATTSAKDILALQPDGVFLSNGPGDPAATAEYSREVIRELLKCDIPLFGICLGHQLIALALGGKTRKMHMGHHGANHPVLDKSRGTVSITSMNHGFTVESKSLPADVEETHISLFDGSNCGLSVPKRNVFSVQFHPEASPGPCDSYILFDRFVNMMTARRAAKTRENDKRKKNDKR